MVFEAPLGIARLHWLFVGQETHGPLSVVTACLAWAA